MTAEELLRDLKGAGVILKPGGDVDRLRVNAPAGALTPERRRALRDRKAELLELLQARASLPELRGEPVDRGGELWWKAARHPAVRALLGRFGGEIVEVRRSRCR
ncbi:MAG: hypothetical protein M3348_14045 [Acidobacteriota bacterium]|nr:hypothetical protein [Acidobacteriota bacterium]